METALAEVKGQGQSELVPMSVNQLKRQVNLIQEVMKDVMKDGTHFGKVPGCGDKPALLKAGAEKLAFVFRMAPVMEVIERDLGGNHREYRVTCTLKAIGSEVILGSGLGSANTMEAKYRFRTGPKKLTGRPVPKEYWDVRESDPARAKKAIGGDGFGTAKNPDTGQWEICEIGERVEHDNPADYYNTVLKMAKKRAQIDATLTCTAASDLFTQDTYEDFEEEPLGKTVEGSDRTVTPPSPGSVSNDSKPVTTGTAQTSGKDTRSEASKTAGNVSGLDWRNFQVPFGKAKGAKLGELPSDSLLWWIGTYVPRGFGDRPPSESDKQFRKMLDAAKVDLEAGAGRGMPHRNLEGPRENLRGDPHPQSKQNDEDVPY